MKGKNSETMGKVNGNLYAKIRKTEQKELAERVIGALKNLNELYEYYTVEMRENNNEIHYQAKLGNLEAVIHHEALREAYKDHRYELISIFNELRLGFEEWE